MMSKSVEKELGFIGKKPYALMFLTIFISVSIGAFMLENIAFMNTPNNLFNNNLEFFLLFGVTIVVNLYLLFLIKRYFSIKPNIFPLIIFSIGFIANLIALFILPSPLNLTVNDFAGKDMTISYSLDTMGRIRYAIMFFVASYYAFMIFSIFPKVIKSSNTFLWLFYVGIAICLFFIIYSFVKEHDIYVYMIKNTPDYKGPEYVSSCFNNRNTFGTLMLIGICASAIVQSKRHSLINYLFMFTFYIELFFILSKTSIIISTIFLIVFLIYRFAITIRRYPIRTSLFAILIIGCTVASICFGVLKTFGENSYFVTLLNNFVDAFTLSNKLTFTSRTKIWESCIKIMKGYPNSIVFGVGEYVTNNILSMIFGSDPSGTAFFYAHNGPIQELVSGGVIRLLILSIMIFIFLYKLIKNAANHNKSAITFLFTFFALLAHGFTESTYFFPSDTKGMALCFIFMLPMLVDYEKKDIDSNDEKITFKLKFESSPLSRTSLIISFLMPILIFIGPMYGSIASTPNALLPEIGLYFHIFALVSIFLLFICLYSFNCLNKGRSIFYSILTILLEVSLLLINIFHKDLITFITSLISLLILTIYSLIRCNRHFANHSKKEFFKYLIHLVIFLVLFGLLNFGYLYIPKYNIYSSASYVTYLCFLNVYLYFIYLYFPSKCPIRPLDMKLLILEFKYEYLVTKLSSRMDKRNEKYFSKHSKNKEK